MKGELDGVSATHVVACFRDYDLVEMCLKYVGEAGTPHLVTSGWLTSTLAMKDGLSRESDFLWRSPAQIGASVERGVLYARASRFLGP